MTDFSDPEQAFKVCYDMWMEIAKRDRPEYTTAYQYKKRIIDALGLPTMHGDCAFCEHDLSTRPKSSDMFDGLFRCHSCPWPGRGSFRCEDPGSPYLDWVAHGHREDALAVANIAKEALKNVRDL